MRKRVAQLLVFVFFLCITPTGNNLQAQGSDKFQFSGYIQASTVYLKTDSPPPFPDSFWEYRLQNRIQARWFATQNLKLTGELRTRVYAGDLVKQFPLYAQLIDNDPGFVDASFLVTEQENWFMHTIPDRFFAEWENVSWNVRVGRHRINWGINMMTNPNDLFNIYSFFDFDYPERPGADAIRVQYFLDFASRFEMAYSPANNPQQSVAAGMYAFNRAGYDVQFIGGYYRNRLALGGGWAGNISQTGFKGELSWFLDLVETNGARTSNMVVAVSADHMFANGIFAMAEVLFNERGGQEGFDLFSAGLSADNPSFTKWQYTLNASYAINPLITAGAAIVAFPDEKAVYISPNVGISVYKNLDLTALAQIFHGKDGSNFDQAGNLYSASLKWSF